MAIQVKGTNEANCAEVQTLGGLAKCPGNQQWTIGNILSSAGFLGNALNCGANPVSAQTATREYTSPAHQCAAGFPFGG
jgi:hypothetical protein